MFRKLKGRDPVALNSQDQLLMNCIIREILDAFWSRSEGTVRGYSRKTAKMIKFSNMVGLSGPFKFRKTLLWYDHCRYKVAVGMLLYYISVRESHRLHAV